MKKSKQFRPTAFIVSAKLKVSLMLLLMLMLVPQLAWAAGTKPAQGSGSSTNPYQIITEANLQWFRDAVNGTNTGTGTGPTICAKLMTDITLTIAWTNPIGKSTTPYTGTFDGNGKSIKGFAINATSEHCGLFGYVNGATIQNFTLTGNISSGNVNNVGTVVGTATGNTKIYNVHSSANLSMSGAKNHIGGIVGQVLQSEGKTTEIKGCSYSGTMDLATSWDSNGGIVGYCEKNANVEIEYCSFSGTIKATRSDARVGGILGYADDDGGTQNFKCISNCFVKGQFLNGSASLTGTYVAAIAGYPRGKVIDVIKNNTFIADGIPSKAIGNGSASSTNKAITVSAKCSNVSDGTVDIVYINPTTTTPTQVKLTVKCTDDYDYAFSKWNDGNTDNPRTVSLTDNVNLTATIARTHYYVTLKAIPENDYITVTGAGRYKAGTKVTISTQQQGSWAFVKWSDGVKAMSRTLTMDRDYDLTAEYTKPYQVTAEPNNPDWGTVSIYQKNGITYAKAIPKEGCRFRYWSKGILDDEIQLSTGEGSVTMTAYFVPDYKITTEVNNPDWGKIDLVLDSYSGYHATAVPYAGYKFTHWEDGNTAHSINVDNTQGEVHLKAYFEPTQYVLTVAANNNNYGTVSGGGSFDYGTTTTITATPKAGYHFVKWNEDDNTNASRSITMNYDYTYTAIFEAHTYGDWIIDNPATCTSAGLKHRECTHHGCDAREDGTIPTLEHDLTYHEYASATCSANGNRAYWTCSRVCCSGKYYKDNSAHTTNTYANQAETVISAFGHNDMTYYAAVEGSCIKDGNDEYWFCHFCDRIFKDSRGIEELDELPMHYATGHKWGDDGVCTNCGISYPVLKEGVYTNFKISESNGGYNLYLFVAPEDGELTVFTSGDEDTEGGLFDEKLEALRIDDDGGEYRNFKFTYQVEKGKAYIIGIRSYTVSGTKTCTLTISGKWSVPTIKGDVNNDGRVSVADLTLLIDILNGRATDTTGNADVDGKNGVTLDDVEALRNIILSTQSSDAPDAGGESPEP